VDQSDLKFLIPAEHDTFIDLNIRKYVRGKLTTGDGKDLDSTDFTATANIYSIHSSVFDNIERDNYKYI